MYNMNMARFNFHRYRTVTASLLMLVFLGSQIFSCCLVNERLGNFVKATFATHEVSQPPAHSCCPTPSPTETKNQPTSAPSQHKDCCIQDANQRLPQIPSEHAAVPSMPDLVISLLPSFPLQARSIPARPSLFTSSGPPVYLTQLRLLI